MDVISVITVLGYGVTCFALGFAIGIDKRKSEK